MSKTDGVKGRVLNTEGLRQYIEQVLSPSVLSEEPLKLDPIGGDAGFRQYFRLNTKEPLLAVWAPPSVENSQQFCRVAEFLLTQGVRAPKVFAADLERGFLLVEDFGDRLLLGELNAESADGYYAEAMTMLLHMQSSAFLGESYLPSYDEALLHQELDLFPHWYLERLLGFDLSDSENKMLAELSAKLVARACSQTQVFVHRDFHSRNLILDNNFALVTIDFQDAVIGPISYDLVSLLKDCYIAWEPSSVERWANTYAAMARAAGIIDAEAEASFVTDFHWMGLQRHLKVLGVFSRLWLRDKKDRYLYDLPLVLNYVTGVVKSAPEFSEFSDFLEQRVLPKAIEFDRNLRVG